MTCVVEGCDKPVGYKKRGWCSMHYQRWLRYGTTDLPERVTGPCSFEGCNRPRMKSNPLCTAHRVQQRNGKDLTPIGSTHRAGKNKSTKTCLHEGCDRKCQKHDYCYPHMYQYNRYGHTWDLGTMKRKVDNTYSEERTCGTCNETKNWKRFVMGTDAVVPLCRDCHRKKLSERIDVVPINNVGKGRKKANTNMEELLDFLNNRTN